jgi:hypothetical protein
MLYTPAAAVAVPPMPAPPLPTAQPVGALVAAVTSSSVVSSSPLVSFSPLVASSSGVAMPSLDLESCIQALDESEAVAVSQMSSQAPEDSQFPSLRTNPSPLPHSFGEGPSVLFSDQFNLTEAASASLPSSDDSSHIRTRSQSRSQSRRADTEDSEWLPVARGRPRGCQKRGRSGSLSPCSGHRRGGDHRPGYHGPHSRPRDILLTPPSLTIENASSQE